MVLILAFCIIFPLSACFGEGAEETTETPSSSHEETTAEETLPPEEETTTLYDKLAEMEPLVLLRQAAKKTRDYRSFIKTTEITLDIPDVGKQSREIVYTKNGDDYSEKSSVDGEMKSFVMYSGGVFAIYNSMLGRMGYSALVENEQQYDKLEGNGPVISNPLLFDFSGNENFGDGIVSAGDEGFIVNIDLTDRGKDLLVGNIHGEPESEYSVGKAGIVSWIDREGHILSVSFEAELVIKKLGEENPVQLTAYSTLEEVGNDITVSSPAGLEIYNFSSFDSFYDFYARASYNYSRAFNNGQSFSSARTVKIVKVENNKWEQIYNCTIRGIYKQGESVCVVREIKDTDHTVTSERIEYSFDTGKIVHTEFSGAQVERNDISAEGLYDYVLAGLFANFIGDYEPGELASSKKSYQFKLKEERALELAKEYLTLCGYDAEKCEISSINGSVEYEADDEYSEFDYIKIHIGAKVKYEGREFELNVNDNLGQAFGRSALY